MAFLGGVEHIRQGGDRSHVGWRHQKTIGLLLVEQVQIKDVLLNGNIPMIIIKNRVSC